jgi:hypothetical protein
VGDDTAFGSKTSSISRRVIWESAKIRFQRLVSATERVTYLPARLQGMVLHMGVFRSRWNGGEFFLNTGLHQERRVLFEKTKIEGLWVVNTVPVRDSRGSFARTFCKREFESNALVSDFSQHSLSLSKLKHTVRGLHFQRPPHQETKLVSCFKGSIWDVAVDLRRPRSYRKRTSVGPLCNEGLARQETEVRDKARLEQPAGSARNIDKRHFGPFGDIQ